MCCDKNHRPLYEIAKDIRKNWVHISPYALPYLKAIQQATCIKENYGYETMKGVVLYFLANASTFRGEAARRIKAELKELIK